MSAEFFLDTNVLVYSFEERTPSKRAKAMELIERALYKREGLVSWQVVQEFLNVALHKWKVPMPADDAREYLRSVLLPICRVYPGAEIWDEALRIREGSGLRYYDSLIVASAMAGGARTLYSEDLQDGRRFGALTIRNPFL